MTASDAEKLVDRMTDEYLKAFDLDNMVCTNCGRKMTLADEVVFHTSYSLEDGVKQKTYHRRCLHRQEQ
jgi:hypothetical protein